MILATILKGVVLSIIPLSFNWLATSSDSSPYFFLNDNTSISYRKNARKWPKSGIVFFCSADNRIKNILEKGFGLEVFDNSRDEDRPTAVFVPVEMIDNVIEAIK